MVYCALADEPDVAPVTCANQEEPMVLEPEPLVFNADSLAESSKQQTIFCFIDTGDDGVCHVAAVEEVAVNT